MDEIELTDLQSQSEGQKLLEKPEPVQVVIIMHLYQNSLNVDLDHTTRYFLNLFVLFINYIVLVKILIKRTSFIICFKLEFIDLVILKIWYLIILL